MAKKKKMTKALLNKTLETIGQRLSDDDDLSLSCDYGMVLHEVLTKLSKTHSDVVATVLNDTLESWANEDAFGTEGQNDPRGDGRDA